MGKIAEDPNPYWFTLSKRFSWSGYKQMLLLLKRRTFTDKSTIGDLCINTPDNKFCVIMEPTSREKGVKVKDKTCIPNGTYKIKMLNSPHFKEVIPHLSNQSDGITIIANGETFENVEIHWGNKPCDTDACLLAGDSESFDYIGNSRVTFEKLKTKIVEALAEGEVNIEITGGRS